MITVTKKIHFATKARRKCITNEPHVARQLPQDRVPRVSRLMALAIRFDQLLRDGVVADQSELSRLAQVTQPRMTQIMNLNHLAPDIQEELLHLPPIVGGRDTIHEKMLRPVCAELSWGQQRRVWQSHRREAIIS